MESALQTKQGRRNRDYFVRSPGTHHGHRIPKPPALSKSKTVRCSALRGSQGNKTKSAFYVVYRWQSTPITQNCDAKLLPLASCLATKNTGDATVKKETGTLYRTDGRVETVHPHDGRKFSLAELQGFVGGFIEKVPGTARRGNPIAYCNEDGISKELPPNFNASEKFHIDLVGDVIQVRREL
jgi:hypothetical protein